MAINVSVTNFEDVLTLANSGAGNYLFTGILYMVFFVIFITLGIPFGWEASLLVSLFFGFTASILLAYAGLTAWWVVGTFVGGFIFLVMYLIYSSKYD